MIVIHSALLVATHEQPFELMFVNPFPPAAPKFWEAGLAANEHGTFAKNVYEFTPPMTDDDSGDKIPGTAPGAASN